MTARIKSIDLGAETLCVSFGSEKRTFGYLWLRDHAQDPDSFHPKTKQRLLETFSIGSPVPENVSLENDGMSLALRWKDGCETTRYTAEYLAAVGEPSALYNVISDSQVPWDGPGAQAALKKYGHAEVSSEKTALHDMLRSLRKSGMALVTGMPPHIESVGQIMGRIGYIRHTIFGDLWEFSSDGKIDDTAATPLDIKPHTDGTYSHDAPGLQALLCMSYRATGGNNTLVDGLHIAGEIRRDHPDAYRVLCETPVPGQYIGDGAHLVAQRPPFRVDAAGRLIQVSYNNHDRAPFLLPEPQMSRLYDSLALLDRMVNDPTNQLEFGLRQGEMVIFDNWRLLHGRKAFRGHRKMGGCYINREDFESSLRSLARQPLDMSVG